MISFVIDPSPSALVANTVTTMSEEGGQNDEVILNTCLHIPPTQEEAGVLVEPQLLPEMESE